MADALAVRVPIRIPGRLDVAALSPQARFSFRGAAVAGDGAAGLERQRQADARGGAGVGVRAAAARESRLRRQGGD
ncbi:MAG: hypothetical protein ACK51F_04740, partial [Rhodospirillales bacterium]